MHAPPPLFSDSLVSRGQVRLHLTRSRERVVFVTRYSRDSTAILEIIE